jgi:hypothetical protein
VNDWNAYQQKLYEQGYYQQPSYNYYDQNQYQYQHQYYQPAAATPEITQHKGKDCKHKTHNIHNKHDEKEIHMEPVTETTTTSTTKKPPILAIDIGWPTSSSSKPSHVKDKLHATEELISNTFNETIDKVTDQVDKAFTAIKQLVDKSVENLDNKAGQVQQGIEKEKSKLFEKFNKKFQAIEQHFKKFKGSVKRMDFDDDEKVEEGEEVVDELRSIIIPNKIESEEGKAELRSDIKSSISDAIATAQEKFNKLVDDQVGKINKKIADVGDKLDDALNKFYSTVDTLKVTPSKPEIIAPTKIDLKPKATTPLPILLSKTTTPEYYKYTDPTVQYRKKEESAVDSIESVLMSDIKEEIIDDMPKNIAESADVDGLIDVEVERVVEKSEITSDNGKSVDDLQSEIIENVKDALKSDVNAGIDDAMEEFDENSSVSIIPTIDDGVDNDDDVDVDEDEERGKASIE